MLAKILLCLAAMVTISACTKDDEAVPVISLYDLNKPTGMNALTDYYNTLKKGIIICEKCGFPSLGTAMHLDYTLLSGSMQPAVIPLEYLITKLIVIDVSHLVNTTSDFVLTREMGLKFKNLKHDPWEHSILLFKFGWKENRDNEKMLNCICNNPGLSYDLAEWIAVNMSRVVGVATDGPTLESAQTREMTKRTVTNRFAQSGIYMIDNVYLKSVIPEVGCMAIVMPLKMMHINYVPTRFTAACPSDKDEKTITFSYKKFGSNNLMFKNKNDINLEELMK